MKITPFFLTSFCLLVSAFAFGQNWQSQQSYSDMSQQNYSNQSIYWYTNYQEAAEQARLSSKPLVILFTGTNWCPACGILERSVLRNAYFNNQLASKFVFLKAEFSEGNESAIAQSQYGSLYTRYHVKAFPTIIVTNADGSFLYEVNYQTNGPEAYVREFLSKLSY